MFSRAHRRLVVTNKLSAVAAAAAAAAAVAGAQPGMWSSRSQPATPHVFNSQNKEEYEDIKVSPMADTQEASGSLREVPAVDGTSAAAPSGIEALAVLSVQPTPLPVPLYAPTITVTVEASVVTLRSSSLAIRGFQKSSDSSDTAKVPNAKNSANIGDQIEPRVVVGSLLLHGGTRGMYGHWGVGSVQKRRQVTGKFTKLSSCDSCFPLPASKDFNVALHLGNNAFGFSVWFNFPFVGSALHVLSPLHIHAAEGSIRLRQRSALVLAPRGNSEEEQVAESARPFYSKSTPEARRLLLGASVLLSSAASVSVGEGASVRIIPGRRNFSCRGDKPPGSAQPQHGLLEASAEAVGLLASERLLLHGSLGLSAAPSDCLPAPLRKAPVLLYGGREVSLSGEQHLDRLILLSQGTVTLAGSCTVGEPHRCNVQRTPLMRTELNTVTKVPASYSSACRVLERYAGDHVAAQLQTAGGLGSSSPADSATQAFQLGEARTVERKGRTKSSSLQAEVEPAGTAEADVNLDCCTMQTPIASSRQTDCTAQDVPTKAEEQIVLTQRLIRAVREVAGGRKDIKALKQDFFSEQGSLPRNELPLVVSRQLGERYFSSIPPLDQSVPVDPLGRVASSEVRGANSQQGNEERKAHFLLKGLSSLLKQEPTRASLEHAGSNAVLPAQPISPDVPRQELAGEPRATVHSSSSEEGRSVFGKPQGSSAREAAYEKVTSPGPLNIPSLVKGPTASFESVYSESTELPGKDSSVTASVIAEKPRDLEDTATAWSLEDAEALLLGGAVPWSYLDAAVFAGESLLLESGASLVGGALLLCGNRGNTELRGTVDASRRGCQPAHGKNVGQQNFATYVPKCDYCP